MSSSPSIAGLVLLSADPAASASFYSAVFGWRTTEVDRDTVGLTGRDGTNIGRVCRVADDPVLSTEGWIPLFGVSDPLAVLAGLDRRPGRRKESAEGGWVAEDATGARFGVVAARTDRGAVGVHVELATQDVDAACAFYASALDVQFDGVTDDAFGFRFMFAGDGRQIGGVIDVSEFHTSGPPPQWMPYFTVDDVDQQALRAMDLGALLRIQPESSPIDRYAVLADPNGTLFGLSDAETTQFTTADLADLNHGRADTSEPTTPQ